MRQSYIAVTTKTNVAMTKAFTIPDEIRSAAPALPGTEAPYLKQAMLSPAKSIVSVKGKIVKISSPSTRPFNGEDKAFQELVLKDKTGTTTLSIWEDMVGNFDPRQIVKATKCRVRLYNEEKKLTTTRQSTVEVLCEDETLDDVFSEQEDIHHDEPAALKLPSATIVALFEVDPYLCCSRPACNNKKLLTVKSNKVYLMQCQTCFSRYRGDNANIYLRATVMLCDAEGSMKKVSVFKPNIEKMLASRGLDTTVTTDREEMLHKLMELIPIEIKYTLTDLLTLTIFP